MLRSSRIPPLLSRITGDGIHTALLITSDGELLGSSSIPMSTSPQSSNHTNGNHSSNTKSILPNQQQQQQQQQLPSTAYSSTASTSSISSSPPSELSPPLDNESIAALIAEVTSDYRRAGHDLLLLNVGSTSSNLPGSNSKHDRQRGGGHNVNQGGTSEYWGGSIDGSNHGLTAVGGNGPGGPPGQGGVPEHHNRDENGGTVDPSNITILSCLLLEMEMGLIGVASAGPDCLVIAIADLNQISQKVEHGLMKARLLAVAGYIRDSFSQLNVDPL